MTLLTRSTRVLRPSLPDRTVDYYRVVVEGTGIIYAVEDGKPPAVGFYVTRALIAEDFADAIKKALTMTQGQWYGEEYGRRNRGSPPGLRAVKVELIELQEYVLAPEPRYAFFTSSK